MKIPLAWLNEILPTKLAPAEINEVLTSIGLEVEGEDILEIALTPNLSHCASVYGVARELASVTQEHLTLPQYSLKEEAEAGPIEELISVTVEDMDLCPRYSCRLITGLQVAPSPDWLKQRLEDCGMRSINNVVDATNLVLLELGHPLHAFDYDLIEGKKIIVRRARKGETIGALDGKEYYPTPDTLLIADSNKAIAIAGIMGGANSEVHEHTHSVLLESAYFEPAGIRMACRQLALESASSHRFERGCDPNGVIESLNRAAYWIAKLGKGKVAPGITDLYSAPFLPRTLSCRLQRINRLLGTRLAMGEVETLLRALNFEICQLKEDLITVKVPTYRVDITQEIDLIEEVARLYGYNNLHKKEKPSFRMGSLHHSPEYLFAKEVRTLLVAQGLQELLTCDLIGPAQASLMPTDHFPSRSQIKLLNPHSIEQSIMRPSMLPGILSAIHYNASHDTRSLAAFEVGRVHFASKGRYFEPSALAIALTGTSRPANWSSAPRPFDFFDLKGIIEGLFKSLHITTAVTFHPSQFANFHPGRQAVVHIGEAEIGIMGEIHPSTLNSALIDSPVYFAELNLEDLQSHVAREIKMAPLPLFPASIRDWTITVDEDSQAGALLKLIQDCSSTLLESYSLIAIYKSPQQEGKNLTFRFVYRDKHKTIAQADVEAEHLRITQTIDKHLQRKNP